MVGEKFDYRAWNANAALEAAIPVLLAIVIAIVAGTWWFVETTEEGWPRRRGCRCVRRGGYVIALVAHGQPTRLESRERSRSISTYSALGLASGAASCDTHSDGSFSVGSDPAQLLAGTPVTYDLSSPGSAAQGRVSFELFTEPGSGAGPHWDTNVEGDTTFDIRIDGQAAAGRAALVDIPRGVDVPREGGFPGVVPEAISGVMTWTCETPRGGLTPIEGSWFR